MMTVISGQKCLELSTNLGPIGLLEKMLLTSPIWNSTAHYSTWKTLGTKQGHLYYQLQPWGRGTSDQEHLLWPTPIASDGIAWKYTRKADVGRSVRMALTNKPGIRRGQKRVECRKDMDDFQEKVWAAEDDFLAELEEQA